VNLTRDLKFDSVKEASLRKLRGDPREKSR
jgi:hypothetical protein